MVFSCAWARVSAAFWAERLRAAALRRRVAAAFWAVALRCAWVRVWVWVAIGGRSLLRTLLDLTSVELYRRTHVRNPRAGFVTCDVWYELRRRSGGVAPCA